MNAEDSQPPFLNLHAPGTTWRGATREKVQGNRFKEGAPPLYVSPAGLSVGKSVVSKSVGSLFFIVLGMVLHSRLV